MSVKVLVVDDHNIIRQGIVRLIESDGTFEIVGEAGDGTEAIRKIIELKPDIAIMDISMPDKTGLEVIKEINKQSIKIEFIILTMYEDEEYLNEAIEIGVKGYVLKENTAHDLITALNYVTRGKSYISPLVSAYLIKRNSDIKTLIKENPSIELLSPAEKRILKLISENKTSKEIGIELGISYRTVQNHRSNICSKLTVKGMNALLKFAIENKYKL